MLSLALRFLAQNATRRSIRKLWELEGSAMRLLSVALGVSYHSRSSCPFQKYSVAYESQGDVVRPVYWEGG